MAKIKGWGNYPTALGKIFRPERVADLFEFLNGRGGLL